MGNLCGGAPKGARPVVVKPEAKVEAKKDIFSRHEIEKIFIRTPCFCSDTYNENCRTRKCIRAKDRLEEVGYLELKTFEEKMKNDINFDLKYIRVHNEAYTYEG